MTATAMNTGKLAVCISNTGYEASLERRKIYTVLVDTEAKKHKLLRVIDESGEDYLFPEGYFLSVALPPAVRQALLAAA
jgi:archaellum component FlaG (FlaF/FlaG flagellin family)